MQGWCRDECFDRTKRVFRTVLMDTIDKKENSEIVTTNGVESATQTFGILPPMPHPVRHPLQAIGWLVMLAAGLVSLVVILAVLAAIPVANFLVIGCMLEAEGRVARTGRLRESVPLIGALPRLGGVALGIWLWLVVVRLIAGAAADAMLVDPLGGAAIGWQRAKVIVTAVVGCHILLALAAGGKFSAFFRPLRNARLFVKGISSGGFWQKSSLALDDVLQAVQPGKLMKTGFLGCLGAAMWLILPTVLFAAMRDTQHPAAVLLTLVGAVMLMGVLAWVPFLQARFAAEERFSAFRELSVVRELFRKAPLIMLVALVVLYGLSLPLYLFKVLVPPRDALWYITPVFVMTIYPARIIVGWATGYAMRCEKRQWLVIRIVAAVAIVPLMGLYLFFLFFMPAIGALGRRVLFEHHALLLPTPF